MTVESARLLTVTEVAHVLRQKPDTVRDKIRRGEIKAVRLGETGPLRVPEAAIVEHLHPARGL